MSPCWVEKWIGYRFYKQNKILFDIDWSDRSTLRRIYEVALEIKF